MINMSSTFIDFTENIGSIRATAIGHIQELLKEVGTLDCSHSNLTISSKGNAKVGHISVKPEHTWVEVTTRIKGHVLQMGDLSTDDVLTFYHYIYNKLGK